MLIFFSEASIPVNLPPSLYIGSVNKPPPHPMSKISKFDNGFILFLILNSLIILFFIYSILIGLNLCKGLNFSLLDYHSSAKRLNFSISSLFIVLIAINFNFN